MSNLVSTIKDPMRYCICLSIPISSKVVQKAEDMLVRLKSGDQVSLARAITIVENQRRNWRQLLDGIYPLPGKCLRIGITGAPGSGKSTLVSCLINGFRAQGRTVGVLAVDPSSPLSGGALLGDRIRMIHHSNDHGVFIRSLASRGSLGGLSGAALPVIDLMQASGKDVVIIETVGVGQSEIDVVNVADVVLMVLTPAAGDEIQIFKAGIIEIADVFVINKADMGGAEQKVTEIANYFAFSGRDPEVAVVSAREETGIDELIGRLQAHADAQHDRIAAKKRRLRREFVLRAVEERVRRYILDDDACLSLLEANPEGSPLQVAEAILERIHTGGTEP